MPTPLPSHLQELAGLLDRRIEIIGDLAFRERDPEGHLKALKSISESIAEVHARLKGDLPPRLDHFLSQCSYQKARDFISPLLPDTD
jgi:hypothetical protein